MTWKGREKIKDAGKERDEISKRMRKGWGIMEEEGCVSAKIQP